MPYNHREIEPKWQKRWEEQTRPSNDSSKTSYQLVMFPYPSGSGLHVGHALPYTAMDILVRKSRMEGENVLFPIGFDAFGLPAENYAIKTGVHPSETTRAAIKTFTGQMKAAGFDFDWDRQVVTSEPNYYKWTQWLFLEFYKAGLAYKKQAPVNWCESCQTVLANEQVVGGLCERCDSPVVQKDLAQWFFGITKYADRLLAGLETIDWPDRLKTLQRNWIGKSNGAEVTFKVKDQDQTITVFTTRPDTLFGATYLVLAPEHPLVEEIVTADQKADVETYAKQAGTKSALERAELQKEKTGVFTGAYAVNPVNGEALPIWVADYVLTTYGTGAIMAVPAHDDRDFEFASKYNLPINHVVAPSVIDETNPHQAGKPVTERETVQAIVRDPKTGKYLCLKWKTQPWTTFVLGGVEDGEDLETAARREILEETGYTDVKLVRALGGPVRAEYFAAHKDENRVAWATALLFELQSDAREAVSAEEQEKHEAVWLDPSECHRETMACSEIDIWLPRIENEKNDAYTGDGVLVNSDFLNGKNVDEAKQTITEWLESNGAGKQTTTYRLRDWLVSRQRYWGAPIPIVYDPEGNPHPVKEEHLPLTLPTDVDYKPKGKSPLASSEEYVKRAEELYGEGWRFEVDTMDTFVDSSWYFLRYTDPKNEDAFAGKAALEKWLPVNRYIGGIEHAVLHLLYARFFCYALKDLGHLSFEEPFTSFQHNGMVLGPDGQKMSKSKGNVINPDDVIADFGADTMRVYTMFMGPIDEDKPWDENGVLGARRFLDKVYRIAEDQKWGEPNDDLLRTLHKTIKKVSEDTDAMRYNTAIAQMMTCVNEMGKTAPTKDMFKQFIQILAPYAPHLAEEMWSVIGEDGSIQEGGWPSFDPELIVDETIELAVQVNGKLRGTARVPANIDEVGAKSAAMELPGVAKHLEGKEIKKVIFVPGRLINFVA